MSADSAVPANINSAMDSTAFRGLNASSSEEMMPLPYWKEPSAKNNHDSIGVEVPILRPSFSTSQASWFRLRARHEHLSNRSRSGGGSTMNRCHIRCEHRLTEPDAVITSSPDPVRPSPTGTPIPPQVPPRGRPNADAHTQENAHARAL